MAAPSISTMTQSQIRISRLNLELTTSFQPNIANWKRTWSKTGDR